VTPFAPLARTVSQTMRVWVHDRFSIPLPGGHRFPVAKYARLRERVEALVLARTDVPGAAPWEDLARVHSAEYLERVRTGTLGVREIRGLGLPWSPELVERGRRSSWGTVEAARDALRGGYGMNLGGGTHHAGPDAGRGYCLFNDVVLAVRVLRAAGQLDRVLVVDCDVHQGDGTAQLCADDPATFTLSVHGAANYPFHRATSDLDVDLATGTGDEEYLERLERALHEAVPVARPDLVVLLAGADPWEGDALGRLSLTKAGLRARDALVMDTADAIGAPLCVTLAGGYAPDVADTVEINLATLTTLLPRTRGRGANGNTGPLQGSVGGSIPPASI
jgi:acetoin utilization deacetylase AcuC-like enzyme